MRYKHDNTALLAHYYSPEEIKQQADYVGDSLDLALWAVKNKPKRIVHASVRFMAETLKILMPGTEVILPDSDSSCSLVEQTNVNELEQWMGKHPGATHVMYINSSAVMKTYADWIVTSRNVDDIVKHEFDKGNDVIFSPDRNMGAYLNYQYGYNMPVYTSVCEVHDKFKEEQIDQAFREWTDGRKYLIAHPESPLPVLKRADFVGSTSKMLNWVKEHPYAVSTIYVATEEGLLNDMRELRPELDIRLAPMYSGCACNACPFMKKNTVAQVNAAIEGKTGVVIDYLPEPVIELARKPIERMMEFSK